MVCASRRLGLLAALFIALQGCMRGPAPQDELIPGPGAAAAPAPDLDAGPQSEAEAEANPAAEGQAGAEPAAELALPADGWAREQAQEIAIEHGFQERFPLHGMAFHMLAQVFAEASARSQVIGYMRRGARFRAAAGVAGDGCDGRWHELATGGFVCTGRGFLLGDKPPEFSPVPEAPSVFDALPYSYQKTLRDNVYQFWREPSRDELAELATLEQSLLAVPDAGPTAADAGVDAGADAGPEFPGFVRMRMGKGFYVSIDRTDESSEDHARTVRGALVPRELLAEPSTAPAPLGRLLGGDLALPLAFAYRAQTTLYRRDSLDGSLHATATLPRHAAVALTGQRVEVQGKPYRVTRAGLLVDERRLRVVEAKPLPREIPADARVVHVDLENQTLVAYERRRALFATLVSTGKLEHETPGGVYRIQSKHVSATMDGLEGTDEAYSIEDVPWTMYFESSFALHAAFWHDRFGQVRSHGCVNLSPGDARWLFGWTNPVLPDGWHGVIATRSDPGTWIWIDADVPLNPQP